MFYKEDPPNFLLKGGQTIDLGRRSPWWGGRKEGTSDLKHSWSQFLVGFIHPVWWHPPDDGRLCTRVAALGSWLIIICPTSSLHQVGRPSSSCCLTTWSPRSSSLQTSSLHQAPLQLAATAALCTQARRSLWSFSPRVQVRVQRSKFDARLEALVAKYTGRVEGASESRGHQRLAKI